MDPPTRTARGAAWRRLALSIALACSACAAPPAEPVGFFDRDIAAAEEKPLGGDALAQRKRDLQRAHRDLVHFRATLESLSHRRDRNGSLLFNGFLDAYLGEHLEPLLRAEWQSRHPELMGLDANLRLAKAELLVRLRDPGRVQRTIEDIERRFAGRETMLVEFPIGEQNTLKHSLALLRERKWRG